MNRFNSLTIFLCGFMGTGKTTLGKKLATLLKLPFRDLDDFMVGKENRSIPEIFEEDGEPYFRSLEKESIRELGGRFNGVLALGGGALQNQEIIDYIKENGILVFIKTDFNTILERILSEEGRPLLLDDDGNRKPGEMLTRELRQLYDSRLPSYNQAQLIFGSDHYETITDAAEALAAQIKEYVEHH